MKERGLGLNLQLFVLQGCCWSAELTIFWPIFLFLLALLIYTSFGPDGASWLASLPEVVAVQQLALVHLSMVQRIWHPLVQWQTLPPQLEIIENCFHLSGKYVGKSHWIHMKVRLETQTPRNLWGEKRPVILKLGRMLDSSDELVKHLDAQAPA